MKENFVICQLCGKGFRRINNFHLTFKHNISISEYRKLFPSASMYSEESMYRYSESALRYWASLTEEEQKLRVEPMIMNRRPESKELTAKKSQGLKKRWADPESRAKWIAGAQSPEANKKRSEAMKGYIFSAERNEKVRQAALKQWREPETRERIVKSLLEMRSPNNQELQLQTILDKHFPNEWKYVGNGQLIIAGFCPDFVNINGHKSIIEFFGEHWHDTKDARIRKAIFAKFGYGTLIIWSKELREENKLVNKVTLFLRGT